jgi:hypothetical protein
MHAVTPYTAPSRERPLVDTRWDISNTYASRVIITGFSITTTDFEPPKPEEKSGPGRSNRQLECCGRLLVYYSTFSTLYEDDGKATTQDG